MADWFRADNNLIGNRKFDQVTPKQRLQAIVMYLAAIGWCAEQESDGWIPESALPQIGRLARAYRPRVTMAALVDVGLAHVLDDPSELEVVCPACWRSVGEVARKWPHEAATSPRGKMPFLPHGVATAGRHFYLHDYLEFQPCRAELVQQRFAAKQRQQRGRDRLKQLQLGDETSRRDVPYPDTLPSRRDAPPPSQGLQDQTAVEQDQVLALTTTKPEAETAARPNPEPTNGSAAAAGTHGEPATIAAVKAAVKSLRKSSPNTESVVMPLALALDAAEFEHVLQEVRASNAVNDAGLLVTLLKRHVKASASANPSANPSGPERIEQPDDAARRRNRLEQIAHDPDDHVTSYAASLRRLDWPEARELVARLVEELPIDPGQREGLLELAAGAHQQAVRG